MKRHPALQDLSRDHQQLLMQSRNISWLAKGSKHAQSTNKVAESLLDLWEKKGKLHLREEEEVFLPFYASRDIENHAIQEKIKAEHQWLRTNIDRLNYQYHTGNNIEELLIEIGEHLHDHIRFEERVVFQRAQEILTDDELSQMWERSLDFRREWRDPNDIGPCN